MGGGAGAPPPAYSNPQATTEEQTKQNIAAGTESQAGSNVNQVTPFGSLSYTQSGVGPGGIPLYTATSQFSPQMQAIISGLQGDISGELGMANYAQNSPAEAIGGPTSGLTQWMMNNTTSYLQPFFTQQQENLDNQLRNQGIFPGDSTGAYNRAMNNLLQSQGQTVTGNLNTEEQNAFNQASQLYGMPLSIAQAEYGMLSPTQLTQSLINPTGLNIQPTDYSSIVNAYNQYQMDLYKQKVAQATAEQSGIFGVAGKVLGGLASTDAASAGLSALGTAAMSAI